MFRRPPNAGDMQGDIRKRWIMKCAFCALAIFGVFYALTT
jgi:hypothetical protein